MKKFLIFILVLTFGLPLEAQVRKRRRSKKPMFYLVEMSFRAGYHMFTEDSSWLSSKEQTLKEDVLFTERSDFTSSNVDTSSVSGMSGLPIVGFELMGGLNLNRLPGMKNVKALKGFQGIRVGTSMFIYPLANNTSFTYSDTVTYNDNLTVDNALKVRSYNARITLQENYLILGQTFNLYYWYEKGFQFGKSKNKLIPYAGVEVGLSFISGKRKLKMETDDLFKNTVASGDQNFTAEAAIQEAFFNSFGLRLSPVLGFQYRLGGAHYIDLRGGFVMQNGNVNLNRNGAFTETAKNTDGTTNYTTSEKVKDETRAATFSLTGIQIMLGYTVGLK